MAEPGAGPAGAAGDDEPPAGALAIPAPHLDVLLQQLQDQLGEVIGSRDRLHGLLDATVALGGDLELPSLLRRVVESAVRLVDARYGALGVVGADQQLTEFITVGIADDVRERIGAPPRGRGLLGELIRDPRPVRTADVASHPSSVGFPAGHPTMHSFLGVPIRIRDEVFGNLYLTDKRGGTAFDADDEALVVAMAASAAVAIQNARLLAETRRRERWTASSAEVTRALLSGDDPSDVLDLIARRARELVGADLATIALLHSEDTLVVEAAAGPEGRLLLGRRLPTAHSLAGRVLATRAPLRVDDAFTDPRSAGPADGQLAYGPSLVVPLPTDDDVPGVLMVSSESGKPVFSAEAEDVLSGFAAQAVVALQLARQRREAERATVYGDRDRIARDLHDLVIQRLFATGMRLDSVASRIADPMARDRVLASVEDLDQTIREIRSTIYSLQHLGRSGDVTVRSRVLDVVATSAVGHEREPTVTFEGPVETALGDALLDQLLPVLREAVSNAVRHADADRIAVTLRVTGDAVVLVVVDDGVGIEPTGRRSGLANLVTRAELLGGTCEVVAARPGDDRPGTRVTWTAPLGGQPDDGT
jgi:signal transduction histidine kinase